MTQTQHRLFGTDGIRGAFGEPPLDRDTVTRLGATLADMLLEESPTPHVVLGGDTRASTPELCRWLAGALVVRRVEWTYLGTLPTPGVALLTRRLDARAGVVVSASHNPAPDNGIKLFDPQGLKWSSRREAQLEERLAAAVAVADPGEVELGVDRAAVDAYLESLHDSVPGGRPLAGLHLALDAANGAASPFARVLFEALGARLSLTGASPDGHNINLECGSTHPDRIVRLARQSGAALGFALDGDADRAVLVDEAGAVRDGDAILFLWATWLAERGELDPPLVVATTMSNLGLERALEQRGIRVIRCEVGDRAVADTMRRRGALLGGEQSGHVLHAGLSSTGDGLLTALQMARIRAEGGRPLRERLESFERYPQVLRNIRVRHKPPLEQLPGVEVTRRRVEERLGREGRLVLRYSGTEPLVRVMLEGSDDGLIQELAEELAAALQHELGAV